MPSSLAGIVVKAYLKPRTHTHIIDQQSASLWDRRDAALWVKMGPSIWMDYFAQVQFQLWMTWKQCCDFVVWTIVKGSNLHVERILLDNEYMENILPKIHIFFHQGTVAQFCTRLRKETEKCQFTDVECKKVTQIITGCQSGQLRRLALEKQTSLDTPIE